MKIRYTGPFESVEIPTAGVIATRGEPIELPDDIAKSLLEQSTYEKVRATSKKATKE